MGKSFSLPIPRFPTIRDNKAEHPRLLEAEIQCDSQHCPVKGWQAGGGGPALPLRLPGELSFRWADSGRSEGQGELEGRGAGAREGARCSDQRRSRCQLGHTQPSFQGLTLRGQRMSQGELRVDGGGLGCSREAATPPEAPWENCQEEVGGAQGSAGSGPSQRRAAQAEGKPGDEQELSGFPK